MPLPQELLTLPTVFAVEDEYQIITPMSREALVSVRVGDTLYYDDSNGIMRSAESIHRVSVPMSVLDGAREYTLIWRNVIERKPYFPKVEEPKELTLPFRPVTQADRLHICHVSDAHNMDDAVIAATRSFDTPADLLVLNGDIPNHSGSPEKFLTVYRIASAVTGGTCPTVFARGNHDTRGIAAERFGEFTPVSSTGKTYYTFRLGALWGMVLDCGEDKPDTNAEYGNTVCFHRFREKETAFIRAVIDRAEREYAAPEVTRRLVICHVPFTYIPKPPFDIEQDTYREWARLLREEIHPDLMLCGHLHVTEVWQVGCERDHLGQPCPVIIGSRPDKNENYFVAASLTLTDREVTVTFNDCRGETVQTEHLTLD